MKKKQKPKANLKAKRLSKSQKSKNDKVQKYLNHRKEKNHKV